MTNPDRTFSLVLALAFSACRSRPVEPAPAPARFELVVAPPGARGARAAGTDAAPPPPSELGTPDPDEPGEPDDDMDGGTETDGSTPTPTPDSDAGVTL
jgi:hypothetical protein